MEMREGRGNGVDKKREKKDNTVKRQIKDADGKGKDQKR